MSTPSLTVGHISLSILLENTYLRGSTTVRLTSSLFCLDSAALLMLNEKQFYLLGQIQPCQTGGQSYSDTSPTVILLLH